MTGSKITSKGQITVPKAVREALALYPGDRMSFDLVNEPCTREDMNEQLSKRGSVPGDVYRKVAKAAAEAIRKENPGRLIIADGNDVGSNVIPDLIGDPEVYVLGFTPARE